MKEDGKLIGKLIGNCFRVLCLLATPHTVRDLEDLLGLKGHGKGRNYISGIQHWCPELQGRLRTGYEAYCRHGGRPAQTWWLDYLGDDLKQEKKND